MNPSRKQQLSTNISLLLLGTLMIISGLLLQVKYHLQHAGTDETVLGISYGEWSLFHKVITVLIAAFTIIHVNQHWQFYKSIVLRKKLARNKQVVMLTIIFVIAGLTGFISWLLGSTGFDHSRKIVMEIHDKIALVLSGYLIFHVAKRMKWFVKTLKE